MKQLQRYEVCESKDIQEGQIYPYTVKDGDDGQYELLIIRYEGKLYCVGGIDTYDGKTHLKEGICFGNKLYSPMNGSAYNIQTGLPELAPAIDELPRFYVEEKNGKVILFVPKHIPKRIIPAFTTKYQNDFRKVVIIGSGPAAFGAIEALRLNGYNGEITLITKDTKLPFDKTKLTKSFKNLNYKNLQLRDEDWYESCGVNFMLGREVTHVDKTHGSPHILLEDGIKVEYDGLIIATGVNPVIREIDGIKGKENISFLQNIEQHKNIKQQLQNAKKITILGNNIRAMECVSTIKREYPNIDIWVIDENKEPLMYQEYGKELYEQILDIALDNKIKFVMKNKVVKIEADPKNQNKAQQIIFQSGLKLDTDLIILMPNNFKANTDFLVNPELDQFEFEDDCRVRCDFNQRTDYKRIFAAGSSSSTIYYLINDRMQHNQWNTAYHQGMTSAYNVLALDIPWHQIPFYQYEIFGKTIQHVGYQKYQNETYIDGDLKNWDFIAYHGINNDIYSVTGSCKQKNKINILNEAIRLNLMPSLTDVKNKQISLEDIELAIRSTKKSGCYKNVIQTLQDRVNTKDVIWIHRERQSTYYNFNEEGKMPDQNYRGEGLDE